MYDLRAIARRFNDDTVKIDEMLHNAARILRLWGTVARKGGSLPERPHRRSALWQLHGNKDTAGQTPAAAGFDSFCLWNLKLDGHQADGNRYANPNLIYQNPKTGKSEFQQFTGKYGPDICAGVGSSNLAAPTRLFGNITAPAVRLAAARKRRRE